LTVADAFCDKIADRSIRLSTDVDHRFANEQLVTYQQWPHMTTQPAGQALRPAWALTVKPLIKPGSQSNGAGHMSHGMNIDRVIMERSYSIDFRASLPLERL
jgi:hypothetical protein